MDEYNKIAMIDGEITDTMKEGIEEKFHSAIMLLLDYKQEYFNTGDRLKFKLKDIERAFESVIKDINGNLTATRIIRQWTDLEKKHGIW